MKKELEELLETAPAQVLHHFACDCEVRLLMHYRRAGKKVFPSEIFSIEKKRSDMSMNICREDAINAASAAALSAAWADFKPEKKAREEAWKAEIEWQINHLKHLLQDHKEQE